MSESRQAKVRNWSLGAAALGMAMWISSIALPIVFGEDRGWTDEDSKAYEDAGVIEAIRAQVVEEKAVEFLLAAAKVEEVAGV